MKQILTFYKKMYDYELSQTRMLHIDSSRIIKKVLVEGREELANEEYPIVPIDDKIGEEFLKILELRGTEVELKYFVLGRLSNFVSMDKYNSTRVYPLFSYDASVECRDEAFFLQIENTSLKPIRNNHFSGVVNSIDLKKLSQNQTIDFHFVAQFEKIINRYQKHVNTDEMLLYPDLWGDKKLKTELKTTFKEGESIIPISVLAIVEKELNTFSTKDELESLVAGNNFSKAILALFGKIDNSRNEKRGILCEELNKSQLDSIDNCNNRVVSIISGPPGTGKSFTIANIAAESVSKGQSVIITSKNSEALEVVENKIHTQLGIENLCVNPTRDKSLSAIKNHLQHILGRTYKFNDILFSEIEKQYEKYQVLHNEMKTIEKSLISSLTLERDYIRRVNSSKLMPKSDSFSNHVLNQRNKLVFPLWQQLELYYDKLKSNKKFVVELLQMVNKYMLESAIGSNRKELRDYQSFLKARDIKRKENLSESLDFEVVLKTFPVWLVKANDISRILPLECEMFDLLVIDEASQCDIPSVLPLIQRAKKCVIVGDVQQLHHLSFIPKAIENKCKREVEEDDRHLCVYRDQSILDFAIDNLDPSCISFLNEHFRSQFPIISFSNYKFYNNKLEVLSKRPVSSVQ